MTIISTVRISIDKFPWAEVPQVLENNRVGQSGMDRFYDLSTSPMKDLAGQPMSYGVDLNTNEVVFSFKEGADLDVVMWFKLTWGGL